MTQVTIDVIVAVVTSTPIEDTLTLGVNFPTPCPGQEPTVPPFFTMKLKARYGVTWCRENIGIDPKVIMVGG